MIEVNLLPEDRRPVERTPLPRFLTIIAGVVGFCVEGILLVTILMAHPQLKVKLKEVEKKITAARDQVAELRTYETRRKQITARSKEIGDLYRFRRSWAPLLHRLSANAVLPDNIWYREIELKEGRAARGKTAPKELYLRGYARGTSDPESASAMAQATQAINRFVENLGASADDFANEFVGNPTKDEPTEIVELTPPNKAVPNVPRHVASFGVKLVLKPKKASKAGSKD